MSTGTAGEPATGTARPRTPSSDLSVAEAAALRRLGLSPVGFVMGSAVVQLVSGISGQMYSTWGGFAGGRGDGYFRSFPCAHGYTMVNNASEHFGFNAENTVLEASIAYGYELAIAACKPKPTRSAARGRRRRHALRIPRGCARNRHVPRHRYRGGASGLAPPPAAFATNASGQHFERLVAQGFIPAALAVGVGIVYVQPNCAAAGTSAPSAPTGSCPRRSPRRGVGPARRLPATRTETAKGSCTPCGPIGDRPLRRVLEPDGARHRHRRPAFQRGTRARHAARRRPLDHEQPMSAGTMSRIETALAALRAPFHAGDQPTFVSDLTVGELILLEEVGYRPVDIVWGAGSASFDPRFTTGNSDGTWWGQAISTAIDHARQSIFNMVQTHQGAGVVAMRLEFEREPFNVVTCSLLGTAVRPITAAPQAQGSGPAQPFLTTLSARDFHLLVRAGYEPTGIVRGAAVVGFAARSVSQQLGLSRENVELEDQTRALYSAGEQAMEALEREALTLGADGVSGGRTPRAPRELGAHPCGRVHRSGNRSAPGPRTGRRRWRRFDPSSS